MRRIAERIGIGVPEQAWPALVRAATFDAMRSSADRLIPTAGILKSNAAFCRRGTSGAGREVLSDEEIAGYHARAAQLAPADLLARLHSPGSTRPANDLSTCNGLRLWFQPRPRTPKWMRAEARKRPAVARRWRLGIRAAVSRTSG